MEFTYPFIIIAFTVAFAAIFFGLFCYFETRSIRQQLCLTRQELELSGRKLLHLSRLCTTGSLFSSLIHELGQPLQTIASLAGLIPGKLSEKKAGDTAMAQNMARTIHQAALHSTELMTQFRKLIRNDPCEFTEVNLLEQISAAHALLAYEFRNRNIIIEFRTPDEATLVTGNAIQIQQLIINLLKNAMEAAVHADTPKIALELSHHKHQAYSGRPNAIFTVRNNGRAIPLTLQRLLFRPYFTTKEIENGTGLGLSICETIVQAHQGRIYFSSDELQTEFRVQLPLRSPTTIAST
ncbi:MAG TPA: hypothetical protein DCS07_12245 [Bdellovibrionales bacterium]|nr:MAG: hypothetical protein A2Z97_08625 [Bdellovibrionales bacterium GWB1_52_6]OFZ02780.1 MAG: hypothetical protein A2X97_04195 [Bdellovibrionales bacterium GWA1_52_35]OFZ44143.1 MAG: hypothetical protein A2070_07250 [Bdellovibrionales bacterium GWC1_52_8]HAR43380.1 hypothetical protein [Bdellovibrionales bacterium]HCM38361.1 hypothetical protein [Bdellovibrionales bacterium]